MSACSHCGSEVNPEDTTCTSCGIPLPPNHADQRKIVFIRWFIFLVVFCFVMMFWLPPDWTS